MTETPVAMRLIRCFPDEGPHSRLYGLWDTLAEHLQELVTVRWYANPEMRFRHGEAMNHIWQEEREFDNRYVILTEHDFLPNLHSRNLLALEDLAKTHDVVCAAYVTRGTTGKPKVYEKMAGGWWVALDKKHVPRRLDFDNQPDPANEIPLQVIHRGGRVRIYVGRPRGVFQDYPFGTHLFWSRHYLDPPSKDLNCGGLTVGAVVNEVHKEISRWLTVAPQDFRDLYAKRVGKSELKLAARHAEA